MQDTIETPKKAALSAVDIKNEVLAGLTTSFAMVPEVVAFAFVAGVNPLVGLYAAFTVGILTALLGGRPGMISGAAGSLAVVSTALVVTQGEQYLFAAVALMGCIQIGAGLLKWGKFIALVPHPVMLGFVNGLAIVIFLAQLPHFVPPALHGKAFWLHGSFWMMCALVALTMAITHFLPRFSKAIPSSLAAIIVVTLIVIGFKLDTQTVGDLAHVKGALPSFHVPNVPFNIETLRILLPYAFILAGVGLTESLLTLTLVDDLTQTEGNSDRECCGQGIANLVTGFMGGMGGCAMIGQSIINVSSGGRRRLSGIVEALCILAFIVFASRLIESVPMAALIGVMFIVVIETFAWSSLRIMRAIPRSDAFVLVLVTVVTVVSNLAVAVLVGVLASALSFAWKHGTAIRITRSLEGERAIYRVHGSLFFASIKNFTSQFDPKNDPSQTEIDFAGARLHDHSALEAVHSLSKRYEEMGKTLQIKNICEDSQLLLTRAPWVTVTRA
ncbi:SulP family inorganic anion transporter [bacterium]|nr:MAG: SulP family inorganic anion transporter [bacterium]